MSSPPLLAWCSYRTNKIDIVDLNTKESYASFDGVQSSNQSKFSFSNYLEGDIVVIFLVESWTLVKEIPYTKLLVSLHHNYGKSANMTVYDISKKNQIKEIFSLDEISGRIIILS